MTPGLNQMSRCTTHHPQVSPPPTCASDCVGKSIDPARAKANATIEALSALPRTPGMRRPHRPSDPRLTVQNAAFFISSSSLGVEWGCEVSHSDIKAPTAGFDAWAIRLARQNRATSPPLIKQFPCHARHNLCNQPYTNDLVLSRFSGMAPRRVDWSALTADWSAHVNPEKETSSAFDRRYISLWRASLQLFTTARRMCRRTWLSCWRRSAGGRPITGCECRDELRTRAGTKGTQMGGAREGARCSVT